MRDVERKLNTLSKRADHLASRIANAAPRRLTYDEAELSALRWAIEELSTAAEERHFSHGGD